jgi:RNA polymerase sigma-32 factor
MHITPEQQLALAREYVRTRSPEIESQLVESQLRLVRKLARGCRSPNDREDLFQEGCLGVVHAVRQFDPERGVRLSTYAAWWIRAYQLRWLLGNHRLVKIGKTARQRRLFFQGRALRATLTAAGQDASNAVLARRLGVDEQQLALDLGSIDAREVPLEGPLLAADAPVDERLGEAEAERVVARELSLFVKGLRGRDRVIVESRWLKESPTPFRDLGRQLGVSRERVRQLEHRLLVEMKRRLPQDLAA